MELVLLAILFVTVLIALLALEIRNDASTLIPIFSTWGLAMLTAIIALVKGSGKPPSGES